MANEYVNKVVYNGNTLVDLTGDTVTPQTLSRGVTAHNAAGQQIVGQNDGAGSGDYFIDVTYQNGTRTYTFQTDYAAEAMSAISSGANAYVRVTKTIGGEEYIDTYLLQKMGDYYLSGAAFLSDDGLLNEKNVFVTSLEEDGCSVDIYEDGELTDKLLPSVTSSDDGKVAKVSSGAWSKGYQSWNDLTDKPFYEETDPGYNLEIDLTDQNYVSGYFSLGTDVPCKFYRVGDPLTAEQLEGAMGTVYTGSDEASHVIESNYIFEIEENGDTVGLFVAGDMPYALVVNNANTIINYSGDNFGCSGTFSSAGTYLFWLDLSIMESGMTAYDESLVKESVTTVHKIDSKYIPNDYNELNNTPCQTKVYPAFNYVLPDMEEVEPDYRMTLNGPRRYSLYRVGDPLSIEQILGSYLTVSTTEYDDNDDLVTTNHDQYISQEHVDLLLDENTQNAVGYTVFWETDDNFIAAVKVVNEDDALVDAYDRHDGGIVVQSGTYLCTYEGGRGYPSKRLPTSISKNAPTEVYTPIDSNLTFNQIKVDIEIPTSGYATSFQKQLVSGTYNSVINSGKNNVVILNIMINGNVLAKLSFLMKEYYADVEAMVNEMLNGNTPSLHYVLRGEACCVFNAATFSSGSPSFNFESRFVAELKDDDILYFTQDVNHEIVVNLNTGTALADDVAIGNETVSDYKTNYSLKQIYKPLYKNYSSSQTYGLFSFLSTLNYQFGFNIVVNWWSTIGNMPILYMTSRSSGISGNNSMSVSADGNVSSCWVFTENNELYLGIL